MLSPKTVELLTKKLLASLLDECGATNASEGEMVLNKLVAIATQSVETLVGHKSSLDMLEGIRDSAIANHELTKLMAVDVDLNVDINVKSTLFAAASHIH